jgi:hypothetical protein
MIFEMVNGLETCILCCIAFVGMVAHGFRLITAYRSAFEALSGSIPTYSVENSDISALLLRDTENSSVSVSISRSGQLVGCDFSGPPLYIEIQSSGLTSTQGASIAKLHGLRIMYKICSVI